MQIEICMPKLGITMECGTITCWLKHAGDHVDKGEAIYEFESDKLTNVVESPAEGTLTQLLFDEGAEVSCGVAVAYLAAGEGEEISQAVPVEAAQADKDVPKEVGDKRILKVIPTAGARKMIGKRMHESLARSPQGTNFCKADITELLKFKKAKADMGLEYSITDFVVKAVALALKKHPILNSSLIEDKIYMYDSVNIGVAVALDGNLLVPVVKDADKKTLDEISEELKSLTESARNGTIESEALTGGTFSISSLGMYHVEYLTPFINVPEAAILGVGKYKKEPVYNAEKQEFEAADMLPLSLTIDHAVLDGSPAAQFAGTLVEILGSPEKYFS